MKNMTILVILLLSSCAKEKQPDPIIIYESLLINLSLNINNESFGFLNTKPLSYNYGYVCNNCIVNGILYAQSGCPASGEYKDLNAGSNRGKVCFIIKSSQCSHYQKGLIFSYDYSILKNYDGTTVNLINQSFWDKDCNF